MTPLELLPVPLLEWYRDNARALPWREDPTPYHVWLSEIMLQQTRVAAVLGYYERFLEAAPDVASLAALPEEKLMKLWQGLGYYSRARNLQKAAKVIVEKYGGEFPSDYEAVRALPGVGDYTAGAVCSIAFGQPMPAVDGNVLRVAARICGDGSDIADPAAKKRIAGALRPIVPVAAAGQFTQALMELGAVVCVPNGAPLCERCPARSFCVAHMEGRTAELPVRAPKRARRVEERAVWLIFKEGRVALRQRPDRGLLAGLWEYPNELGDALPEGYPVPLGAPEFGCTAKHVFTHIEWRMTIWCYETAGELPGGWVWADAAELRERYSVPSAFAGCAAIVEERLKGR